MSEIYTSKFNTSIVLRGIKSALTETDNPTYVYVSDYGNDSVKVSDNTEKSFMDTLKNITFGKRIDANDVYLMIKRVNWLSGTIYNNYNDTQNLTDSNFFVIASNRAVYKCIYNGGGVPSTSEPNTLEAVPALHADGYVWKYMFRLTVGELTNLANNDLLPVIPDANTTASVIAGTIDYIDIDTGGSGYTAVHQGYIDRKISDHIYKIENGASPISGIYNKSTLYVLSGSGVGTISTISAYTSNTSGRYVTLDESSPDLSINSQYYISPTVNILGDGTGARARSIVGEDHSIMRIEMVNEGIGYTHATASIVANTIYGSGSVVTTAISPNNGHGSDPASELQATNLLISMNLDGSEIGTIPSNTKFVKFGMIDHVTKKDGTTFTGQTFDRTFKLNVIEINGTLQRGDTITVTDHPEKQGLVLHSENGVITGIYINKAEFVQFETLIANTGVGATIQQIEQPNSLVDRGNIISMNDHEVIARSDGTKEIINIYLDI